MRRDLPHLELGTMRTAIAPLLALTTATALSAQTSTDYLVHHAFLPPAATVYVNDGSTGTANDGTPSGSVTLATGPIALGVTLGGAAGDEIDAGPSPLSVAQERTVSVWAKTTATTGIVTPLTFGTNGFGSKWDMDIDIATGGTFELGVGGGRTVGQGASGLNDGQWHLLTAVLPAGGTILGDVRLFVDGAFAYTNSGTRVINTGPGNVVVGRSANGPVTIQHFPGDVADVVIWSEAFSDEQVQSLHDVGMHPNLRYGANEFERLLEVYRQNQPEVTIAGNIWRRTTGLTGPAGLTALPGGGYELVFDIATGDGVHVVHPSSVVNIGTGCPGTGGLTPAISASTPPVTGTNLTIDLSNALANTLGVALLSLARQDLPLGGGCTVYPQLPGATAVFPTSATGTASLVVPVPANQALLGQDVYAQWFIIDPAGTFGAGLASISDGLHATIGDV